MRFTIFNKLFISIIGICGIIIISMTLIIQQNFKNELQNFVNKTEAKKLSPLIQNLQNIYAQSNSWDSLQNNERRWNELVLKSEDQPNMMHPQPMNNIDHHSADEGRMPPPPGGFVPIFVRVALLDVQGNIIANAREGLGDVDDNSFIVQKIPITLDNALIGWIGIRQKREVADPLADAFSNKQLQTLAITSLLAAVFAIFGAYFLMRHFLRPLHELRKGADALADGQLDYHIPISSSDEIAELTQTFNNLSGALTKQKETRDQWLSDISHELRTPIAVLRSEIEAIQDGIRQADKKNLDLLHHQVMSLSKIINDLHQLSLSDAGMAFNFEQSDLLPMVQKVCELHKPRLLEKNISLELNFDSDSLFKTTCDLKAISQVMTNLLENSYRYTDENGQVSVDLKELDDHYEISFQDSLPGVPDESLPKLFERLYRVDKSRNRETGGSGLGLAICKQIIEAHHGHIISEHSSLGGLKVKFTLPKEM